AIPPVYKNDDPFTGGADAYLETLTGEIVPAIISELGSKPAYIALVGYSLAGLFAVYAMYRTKLFSRIASVSGSLWYPGFMDYAKSHELAALPPKLYLSLGDKEARTRNQIMAKVEQNSRDLHEYYKSLGINTIFELNEGNHFKDAGLRIAKAITWITD
ncbi:MAG: alpha/beta hydrolase, partial [Ruminiclostridium sp.]|uniref:alpha/beta hydrolase n=1 Tax=Ruminococcus sp. TaxID=41978 RepID=UPI0025E81877